MKSPCRKIKSIKTDKYVRKPICSDDLERMRLACKTLRERSMLEVFLSTGARLDEIQKLNRSDIDWKDDSCFVWGKGGKERKVYLNAKARVHLQEYLNTRTDDNPALFVASKGAHLRLGRRSIEIDFHNIGERAGINTPVFPHRMRHTAATNALKAGAPLEFVQKMVGHESPATTLVYTHTALDDIKGSHAKYTAA